MKKSSKSLSSFIHHKFEDETQKLEALAREQALCKHKFVDSEYCLKCGFKP